MRFRDVGAVASTRPVPQPTELRTGPVEQGRIRAQVLAGYTDARSGRPLAYALFVNDAGAITDLSDVLGVIQDETDISTVIQQMN